jgi:hypothetical protein
MSHSGLRNSYYSSGDAPQSGLLSPGQDHRVRPIVPIPIIDEVLFEPRRTMARVVMIGRKVNILRAM